MPDRIPKHRAIAGLGIDGLRRFEHALVICETPPGSKRKSTICVGLMRCAVTVCVRAPCPFRPDSQPTMAVLFSRASPNVPNNFPATHPISKASHPILTASDHISRPESDWSGDTAANNRTL